MERSPGLGAATFAASFAALALAGALLLGRILAGEGGMGLVRPVPVPLEERVARGAKFYAQACAHCHGETGVGDGEDGGADIRNLARSRARIASVIAFGIKGEMPSFRKRFDADQIADLVDYVRTLKGQ